MSARVRRHAAVLKVLAQAKPPLCKAMIRGVGKDVVHCLGECAHNVLKGNVPLTSAQKTKLTRHKKGLRALTKKQTSEKKKRQILQTGGFLPALLAPLLAPLIAPLATKVLGKLIR